MTPTGANVTVDLSLSFDVDVGFVGLRWHDRLSEPFTAWLDVVTADDDLDPANLLQATVGLSIRGDGRRVQHLWGEVDRVEHHGARRGLAQYRLRLRPQLARLERRRGSRTFTDMAVDDIVATVVAEHGIAPPLVRTDRSLATRELVVQLDESDLDFVRRLLGEEPVWWLVVHDTSGHRLAITDRPTNRRRKLAIVRSAADGDGLLSWVVAAELGTDGAQVSATGRSTAVGVDVGEVVHVAGEDGDFRGAFTVVAVDLALDAHEDGVPTTDRAPAELMVDLDALPADTAPPVTVTAPVTGRAMTATVVGAPGETVHVDDQGRVQVDIDADTGGAGEGEGVVAAWVPVVQPWAGAGHGTAYWPRVGDRVWVEFEGGDPSRPVVTGSLYTDDVPPPAALPVGKRRAIVSSGAGAIELDDTPGHEQLILEAVRGLSIAVDQDLVIDGRHDGTVGVDGRLVVEADQEVVLRCGPASITLESNGNVRIQGQEVRIDGHDVRIDGEEIVLRGESSIDLSSPRVTGT